MNSMRIPRLALRLGLGTVMLAVLACLPTKDKDLAGSGTEVGNVIGILYAPDNLPAGGIEVLLYPLDGDSSRILTTRTSEAGAFGFDALPGTYRLVSLDGRGNGVMVDSLKASEEDTLDLSRRTLGPLGNLAAYVRVANVQGPAQVELRLLASPFAKRVEPNAGFEWQGIPGGRYWLHVYYPGSRSREIPVVIEPGVTTALPDTLEMEYEYSFGISRRDTLILASRQLPYTISDKVFAEVDTVYWVVNGQAVDMVSGHPRAPTFHLTRAMLRDTGLNLIELRMVMADTAVSRHWYVRLDDSAVKPWPYHAIRAVFLAKEPNPRPAKYLVDLGRFRILQRRLLSAEELVFWEREPVADADTAIPGEITIPIVSPGFDGYVNCGSPGNKQPTVQVFPGDTVTFFLHPDTVYGGQAFRIKGDESFEDLHRMAYFARARWPLADFLAGKGDEKFIELNPYPRSDGLHFRQVADYIVDDAASTCLPLSRRYVMDSAGAVREYLATPPGFSSATLLLHFRADFRDGVAADLLPSHGTYVYIDSSGKGLAGSGTVTRGFQLSAGELSELRAGLGGFPSPVPSAWEIDYMDNVVVRKSADSTQYLFSDNRGTIFYRHSQTAPAGKRSLFTWVEAWLRGKGWI